ncbi:hypothetical protein EB796_021269 [Bugula neritina]|uniref:Nematode cuticle collagen N-terminal domain-containing protein n=1 Tax=Bugula neritina TaxID=10212 RepID=A0A7J7J3J1_BUGNE|nr:hypothetical protein EB796_021269 [Bugula neritina]
MADYLQNRFTLWRNVTKTILSFLINMCIILQIFMEVKEKDFRCQLKSQLHMLGFLALVLAGSIIANTIICTYLYQDINGVKQRIDEFEVRASLNAASLTNQITRHKRTYRECSCTDGATGAPGAPGEPGPPGPTGATF